MALQFYTKLIRLIIGLIINFFILSAYLRFNVRNIIGGLVDTIDRAWQGIGCSLCS